MSNYRKPAASEKLTLQDLWSEISIVRSGIDELLKQAEQTKDLTSVRAALNELQLKTSNYEKLLEEMQGPLKALLGKNFLGTAEWEQGFGVKVGAPPPIPENITAELLNSDCPLHPGQLVKQTHILILIPKTVDGEHYSALKLDELCAMRMESGKKLIPKADDRVNKWRTEPWSQARPSASEWILIPNRDPDPYLVRAEYHLRCKDVGEQAEVYKHYAADYREAKALELMTAALLNAVVNGERILSDCYLRTKEPTASGNRVVVGFFGAEGLHVEFEYNDITHSLLGGALARKTSP